MIADDRRDDDGFNITRHIQNLLTGFTLRNNVSLWHNKPVARTGSDQQFAFWVMFKEGHNVMPFFHIKEETDGLACPSTARQLVCTQRIESSIGGKNNKLICCLRMEDKAAFVALFVFKIVGILNMTFKPTHPAFFRTHHCNGFTFHHRFHRNRVHIRRVF